MNQNASRSIAEQPFRCLIVQLSKLSDSLQGLMALRAAKQLYPGMEIHYITRESHADAAKRVPWITEVIAFPDEAILDPVLKDEKTESAALSDIARWVRPLVQEPWDFVINWSYSEASSFLTGLIPGRIKLGYSRRKDTSFSSVDGWSHYIQAVVQGGVHQNIHLTDILTTQLLTALQIHVGDPVDAGNAPVTSKQFFALHEVNEPDMAWPAMAWKDYSKKWIAIQLGGGNKAKNWDVDSWQKLIGLILKNEKEWNIILLGGEAYVEDSKALLATLMNENASELHRVVSLVGKTNFDLWANILARCQWLLSTDTAAVHLASVLGTRVLTLALGPSRWTETGPYGNGHYVVTGNVESSEEKAQISPEAVFATLTFATTEWTHRHKQTLEEHFAKLGYESKLPLVRLFRSKIRPSGDGGGVYYEPILLRPINLSDWTAMVMGHIARSWYCGWVPNIGQELTRETVSPALLKQMRELDDSTHVLAKICSEAILTAVSLQQKSSVLKSDRLIPVKERDELQDLGKKLIELDTLIDRLAKTHLPLAAFGRMSRVLMHNLPGFGLYELSQETVNAYKQLNEGVNLLREWIKHTLALAKPKVVAARTKPQEPQLSP